MFSPSLSHNDGASDSGNGTNDDELVGGEEIFRKGAWTSEEDEILARYVTTHGEGNWNAVQKNSGLARSGKSCRLRWTNHLRPDLKKGAFTEQEEMKILKLHAVMGNKWSKIAEQMPGRTDNEIKNYWNTRRRKCERAGVPLYPPEIFDLVNNSQIENQVSQSHGSGVPSPSPSLAPDHHTYQGLEDSFQMLPSILETPLLLPDSDNSISQFQMNNLPVVQPPDTDFSQYYQFHDNIYKRYAPPRGNNVSSIMNNYELPSLQFADPSPPLPISFDDEDDFVDAWVQSLPPSPPPPPPPPPPPCNNNGNLESMPYPPTTYLEGSIEKTQLYDHPNLANGENETNYIASDHHYVNNDVSDDYIQSLMENSLFGVMPYDMVKSVLRKGR